MSTQVNALQAARLIARQTATLLHDSLGVASMVYRDVEREFGPGKTGDVVTIRAPVYFEVMDGPSVPTQQIIDRNIALRIDRYKSVRYPFALPEATLFQKPWDRMSDGERREFEAYTAARFAEPAARALAHAVETDVLAELYMASADISTFGSSNEEPNTFDYREARRLTQRLTEHGVPQDNRTLVMSPELWTRLSNDQARLIPAATSVATQAYREGEVGRVAGMPTFESNNMRAMTTGSRASLTVPTTPPSAIQYSATVEDAYFQDVTFNANAANVTVRAGEIIRIANVFAVNPMTKAVQPFLRTFTVLQDATAGGTAPFPITLRITPPLITSGPYRTVSGLPAANAAVTLLGAASQTYQAPAIAFHRNALALASIPLDRPASAAAWSSARVSGIYVCASIAFDQNDNVERIRIDTLYGLKMIQREAAVRSLGRFV